MNALIDTCVVLDALEARGEFSLPARKIIDFAALNRFDGFLTVTSVMDIYGVVLSRLGDAVEAKRSVDSLCRLFNVLDTGGKSCVNALFSAVSDYLAAVTEDVAVKEEIDCIVTRNVDVFVKSRVKVVSPEEFLSIVSEEEKGEI